MVELVDTPDSKSGSFESDGSSPSTGTIANYKNIDTWLIAGVVNLALFDIVFAFLFLTLCNWCNKSYIICNNKY